MRTGIQKITAVLFTAALTLVMGLGLCPCMAAPGENEDTPGELDYYDFSDIDDIVGRESDFDFEKTVKKFMSGDVNGSLGELGQAVIEVLVGELSAQKTVIFRIIIVGIIAALFTNIATAFLSNDISGTGFYITFIMLMCLLTAGYAVTASMVGAALDRLLELMEAVVPVYVLSLGFSSGTASASAFYQVITIVIVLIQSLLKGFILPLVYIYMVTNLINNVTEGNLFTKVMELIKTAIEWIMKALMSLVIGINIIQSMISPIVDSVKTSSFGKAASMIPGVGGVLTSVSGIILGSGTLIKNAIGMAAMVAIVALCFTPVIKAVIISIGYKAAGAILEPVSDKRIVGAVNGLYESTVLLAKILLYAVVFFLLTLAIICNATNQNAA